MNEIKRHHIAKQYKAYYEYYNKAVRPIEEKKPTTTVQGTVQWTESTYPTIRVVK